MTTHKAIREATEEGPFYTAMVAKDDLRALLADLDAKPSTQHGRGDGMRVKTSELTGPALDWAVEEAQGYGNRYLKFWNIGGDKRFIYCQVGTSPSTHWSQGGPIIDREHLHLGHNSKEHPDTCWQATKLCLQPWGINEFGPTPLIAAMRCYVASKLGDEVDVPEELT